jgi:hypothetical protein
MPSTSVQCTVGTPALHCVISYMHLGTKLAGYGRGLCELSAVQCSAVQCSAVQCSAVQCSAVQCSAVQDSASGSPQVSRELSTDSPQSEPASCGLGGVYLNMGGVYCSVGGLYFSVVGVYFSVGGVYFQWSVFRAECILGAVYFRPCLKCMWGLVYFNSGLFVP